MIDEVEKIIDDAYKLYMPQVRSEITDLTRFLIENTILKDGRPINVLEIGTKFGGTFFIWNKFNPYGMNISIDLNDKGIHGGIGDEAMDKRDLWFQERFDNCHFIRGDSHADETKLEVVNLISQDCQVHDFASDVYLNTEFFDFLFIDGDHSFEGVKKDFEDYSPFVKKSGLICFHDIVISDRHHERNVYVGEFWQEIKDEPNFESFEINANEDWAGLGILIKL
jgi:predicted O-methyltransferase YrrM